MNAEQMAATIVRVDGMADDISEIKDSMKVMAAAVTRLAVIEERQSTDRTEIGRLFKRSDNHETRIGALELAQPMQRQTSEWVNKVVWAVLVAVLGAALTFVVGPRLVVPPTEQHSTAK